MFDVHRAEVAFVWTVPGLKFSERLELVSTVAGAKALVRLVADEESSGSYMVLAQRLGLTARRSTMRQAPARLVSGDCYTRSVPWNDPSGRWFSVFLAKDAAVAEEAVRAEAAGGTSTTLGALLGYPKCCTERYQIVSGPEWLTAILDDFKPDLPAPRRSNPLARLFSGDTLLPDFFPCSMYCLGAKRIADQYFSVLESLGPDEMASRVEGELGKPILRVGETELIQLSSCSRIPGWLEFDPDRLRVHGIETEEMTAILRQGRLRLDECGNIGVPSDYQSLKWTLVEFSRE